jgi:hypothetical protein
MKAKIAIVTTALLIVTSSMAYAYDPVGTKVSLDSEINCEFGKGIQGNATTGEQWYICVPKRETVWVFREPIVSNPTPVTETTTATSTNTNTTTVNSTTDNSTSNATSVVTETTTATITNVTIESLYTKIMALFTQLLALIAKLNG